MINGQVRGCQGKCNRLTTHQNNLCMIEEAYTCSSSCNVNLCHKVNVYASEEDLILAYTIVIENHQSCSIRDLYVTYYASPYITILPESLMINGCYYKGRLQNKRFPELEGLGKKNKLYINFAAKVSNVTAAHNKLGVNNRLGIKYSTGQNQQIVSKKNCLKVIIPYQIIPIQVTNVIHIPDSYSAVARMERCSVVVNQIDQKECHCYEVEYTITIRYIGMNHRMWEYKQREVLHRKRCSNMPIYRVIPRILGSPQVIASHQVQLKLQLSIL